MMNCIAVDDEKLILDLMADNIRQVPFLHLSGKCKNPIDATAVLQNEQVDLIFLDIQMPGLSGLQFIRSLKNPPLIILVTAYKEHALEGFDLDVIDYLLKPVSFERFLKSCNKAHEIFKLRQTAPVKEAGPGYFFVYVEYNQVKVTIADILYIEAMKDYVKIFLATGTKPVTTKMSLKSLEEKLAVNSFLRIHKSFLVSADKITAIKRDLICIGNTELPFSETYKAAVESALSR